MFSISSGELLIILVVVLAFIRPDDLPAFAHLLGKVVGTLQAYYRLAQQAGEKLQHTPEPDERNRPAPPTEQH